MTSPDLMFKFLFFRSKSGSKIAVSNGEGSNENLLKTGMPSLLIFQKSADCEISNLKIRFQCQI